MGIWKISLLGEPMLAMTTGQVFPTQFNESLRLVKHLAIAGPDGASSEVLARHLYNQTWEDPQNGLRTQLARLNKRVQEAGGPPIVERNGDRIVFIRGSVVCDLWELKKAVASTQNGGPEAERRAFACLGEVSLGCLASEYQRDGSPELSSDIASEVLYCLSTLSALPTAIQYRLMVLQATATVRQSLPLNSVHTESLLKLYAVMQCRQEVLQTFLDYENFLLEEMGEEPSSRIRDLCECLLAQLEEPFSKARFDTPSKPKLTIGRADLVQKTIQTICHGGRIFIGGISGVGKTHLMQCVASDASLQLFKIAWVNVAEESPEDLGRLLPDFLPDIVLIDGYTAKFAPTLRFLLSIRRYHAVVVVGCAPIGFEYDESITVEPLDPGTRDNPGPATLLLETQVDDAGTGKYRDAAVSLATYAHGLPLSLKLIAGLTKTFGLLAVESQFSERNGSVNNATQFLQIALQETMAQFEPKTSNAIAAMAGFRQQIPISLVNEMLGLDLWALKQLADSGIIKIAKERLEVRISDSICDLLQDHETWKQNNVAHIEFENALAIRCHRLGLQTFKEESLVSHLRTYFHALRGTTSRKEFHPAMKLLTALRTHPGVFTDVNIDPSDFEEFLWKENHGADEFINNALAVGFLHFYARDADAFEEFLVRVMADSRFAAASRGSQIEIYSQLGLALRLRGRFAESEHMFDTGLQMLEGQCLPAVQLKLLYNKSITLAEQQRFADALVANRDAIKFADFAPNDNSKIELLHMEAISMREAGEPEEDVKSALQVALALSRMYKLVPQQGWILQNAVKLLSTTIGPIEAVVISSIGIALHIEEELSNEIRCQVKGTCELLYECLKSLGYQALSLEAKLLKERLSNAPLYSAKLNVYRRAGSADFSLPFSIEGDVVHVGELRSLVIACLRVFENTPEAERAVKEWGLDITPWIEQESHLAIPFAQVGTALVVNR